MIVCVCRRISDQAIDAAIAGGAHGPEAIAAATGAGTDCGCCKEAIEALAAQRSPCSSPPCAGCPRAAVKRAEAA